MNRGVCMRYILLFVIMGLSHSIHARKSNPNNACPIHNIIMNTADPFHLYKSRGIKSMNTICHALQKRSLSYPIFKISFPNEKALNVGAVLALEGRENVPEACLTGSLAFGRFALHANLSFALR